MTANTTPEQRESWRRRARRRHEKLRSQRIKVDGRWFHPNAPHGDYNGYSNYGCRCEPCTVTHSVNIRERKAARLAERVLIDGRLVHPRAKHGTENGYSNYGCRCVPCKDVWRRANRERDARRRARMGGA